MGDAESTPAWQPAPQNWESIRDQRPNHKGHKEHKANSLETGFLCDLCALCGSDILRMLRYDPIASASAGAPIDVDRLLRRAHQRFAVDVVARVEHDADARSAPSTREARRAEPAATVVRHDLRPARAIDAGDPGERVPELRRDHVGHRHVTIRSRRRSPRGRGTPRFRACSDRTADTRLAA